MGNYNQKTIRIHGDFTENPSIFSLCYFVPLYWTESVDRDICILSVTKCKWANSQCSSWVYSAWLWKYYATFPAFSPSFPIFSSVFPPYTYYFPSKFQLFLAMLVVIELKEQVIHMCVQTHDICKLSNMTLAKD